MGGHLGESPGAVLRAGCRAWIAERPVLNHGYRIGVGVLGAAVTGVGILAIPYPGPGWLIVFAGLGILATEFVWARRLLTWGRHHYNRFTAVFARQPVVVRLVSALIGVVVVVATLWLLDVGSLLHNIPGLRFEWLRSPLAR